MESHKICSAIGFACCFLFFQFETIAGKPTVDAVLKSDSLVNNPLKDNPRYDIQGIYLLPKHDDSNSSRYESLVIKGENFDSKMLLAFGKPDQHHGLHCSEGSQIPVGQPRRLVTHKHALDEAYFFLDAATIPRVGQEIFLCTKDVVGHAAWIISKRKLQIQTLTLADVRHSCHHTWTNSTQRSYSHSSGTVPVGRRRVLRAHNEQTRQAKQRNLRKHEKRKAHSSEILGFSFEYDSDKKLVSYDSKGTPHILQNTKARIKLYGRFNNQTLFRFTKFDTCDDSSNKEPIHQMIVDASETVATVSVELPNVGELYKVYMCLGEISDDNSTYWVRQGGDHKPWLKIVLYSKILPIWVHISLISILLVLSGLFSGLNLGLMSLNKTDLKIIINTGTEQEKDYASSITPVRKRGNFLLCCLLFSNVLVNSTLTILVDDLTTGLIAILMSTMAIVIFGEIVPQAICSRHGLAVGARTIMITKFFMVITAPLAYPLSLILDKILGEEIGSVYTRERLKELLKVTKDHHGLANEEVGIISGALEMKTKTVKDIMTKLENVFMLPCDAMLDFDTMAEVEYHGYTRIPVYDGEKNNVVAVLNVKQLTLLDATDSIPLRAVIEYYHNQLFFVFENTHLDYMFRAFREGNRGHMAFVQKVNDEGPGDPYYETMGIVTMEDVLEELLQAEIMDENDVDKLQARSNNQDRRKYVPLTSNKRSKACIELHQPLALASTQYLSTSILAFKREFVSVPIIQRLLRTNVFLIKISKFKYNQETLVPFLYEADKPSEYFTMILDGRVQVIVGRERLCFEAGPFTTFGCEFLLKESEKEGIINTDAPTEATPGFHKKSFLPDYTVKILTDVQYLRLNYSSYRAARLATELERTYRDPIKAAANKNWEDEIDKMLQSGDDFDQSGQDFDIQERIIPRATPKSSFIIVENGDHPNEETNLLHVSD